MLRKILVLLLFLPSLAIAQKKQVTNKAKFQSSLGASILIGYSEPSWNLQLVNGIRINNWFAGIGAGIDNYRYRTVPLFLSARKEGLFKRKLFAYLDAGVSIPAVKDQDLPFNQDDKFYAGFYSETGIGWKIPAGKKTSLRLSAGYSVRTFREKVHSPSFSSFWPDPGNVSENKYTFQLLTIRAAFSLGGQ